jgi:hypothetical protein
MSAVGVAAVADISDGHAVLCFVDNVEHAPFLHHSCRVHTVIWPIQFLADPVGIVCQRAIDELRCADDHVKGSRSAGRARYVIDNPVVTLVLPAPEPGIDDRLVFLGDDPTGRALEIVAVRLPDCLLVIHVQDLQAKFCPYYDQVREEACE